MNITSSIISIPQAPNLPKFDLSSISIPKPSMPVLKVPTLPGYSGYTPPKFYSPNIALQPPSLSDFKSIIVSSLKSKIAGMIAVSKANAGITVAGKIPTLPSV